jgi:hypothetical protein
MDAQVRVNGDPIVEVNGRARIEVAVPISPADEAWRTAFHNALPTRKHAWRITANRDAIQIVVDGEDQLADFFYVVMAAVERANRKIERLEAARSRINAQLAEGGFRAERA